MNLFELKAEISPAETDAIDEILQELGVDGWSLLEDAIARRAWIIGIFPSEIEVHARWLELEKILPTVLVNPPVVRALGDLDWRDSYKAHFHAWQFGRLHWVPIWERERFRLPPDHAVLWLDPGLAFGTGNHETTRLCVERLVVLAEKKDFSRRVTDAGCGSGILALSAALLGFSDVVGFDNDPEAVRVSEENAVLNGLGGRVKFFAGDLESGLAHCSSDILLANIQADVLMKFAPELVSAVAAGGSLVLSGILALENETVATAFAQVVPHWSQETRIMGEWSGLLLTRPN